MEHLLGGVRLPELRWTNEALVMAVVFWPRGWHWSTRPGYRLAALAACSYLERSAGRGAGFTPPSCAAGRFTSAWCCSGAHLIGVLGLARGWLAPSLLAPIMPIGVVGCVLALPLVTPPLMRFIAFILKRPLGLEGRLANGCSAPTRTNLTVGILAIAIFVAIGVGHAILASVHDTRAWSKRVATADFYVRGTLPDGGYAITTAMLPENFEAELAALDGVARVDKLNWMLARAHDQRIVAIACTTAPGRGPALDLVDGDPAAVARGFLQGGAVVGTALAKRLRLGVGDDLLLETRQGPRAVRIVGTTNEYTIDDWRLYVEWHAAKEFFDMQGAYLHHDRGGQDDRRRAQPGGAVPGPPPYPPLPGRAACLH